MVGVFFTSILFEGGGTTIQSCLGTHFASSGPDKDVSTICFWRNIIVSWYSTHSISCSSGAAVSIYCTAPQTFTSVRRYLEECNQTVAGPHWLWQYRERCGPATVWFSTFFKIAFMFSRRRKLRFTTTFEKYKNKTLAYFNFWLMFNVNKTPNTKRKITDYSWKKYSLFNRNQYI